jgi:AcrR family transcriptional regulator
MPTGVAIPDPRAALFDAAERVLLRGGPDALTSRAVTEEAGVAKGVLHPHFDDFDGFLAELVADRLARLDARAAELRDAAGTGTVAANIGDALADVFDPVAIGILGLVVSRDALLARLRAATPRGVPILAEATAMVAGYLRAERDRGRIAAAAGVDALAPILVGTGHLLFADRTGDPPDRAELQHAVAAVLAGVAADAPRRG